jgi:transposase
MSKKRLDSLSINALSEILDCDRRSLKKWLAKTKPSEVIKGQPLYSLSDAKRAILAQRKQRGETSEVKRRQIELQNEKLEHQIGVLKEEYVTREEVDKVLASLGLEIRKTISTLHTMAPAIVGLSIADAESRLREFETEVLTALSNIEIEEKPYPASMERVQEN